MTNEPQPSEEVKETIVKVVSSMSKDLKEIEAAAAVICGTDDKEITKQLLTSMEGVDLAKRVAQAIAQAKAEGRKEGAEEVLSAINEVPWRNCDCELGLTCDDCSRNREYIQAAQSAVETIKKTYDQPTAAE